MRLKPYYCELKAGRTYFWCSCGRSKRQPYCDGSHVGTGFEPVKYVGRHDGEEVLFCACKRSADAPMCDGTHANLPGGSPQDDPLSPANRQIRETDSREGAFARLDGECYVFSPRHAEFSQTGTLRYTEAISRQYGAIHQSQFYAEVQGGPSPIVSMGAAHVVLFVAEGRGAVEISGVRFSIEPTDGVYVRPGEAFRVTPDAGATLRLYISACPAQSGLQFLESMPPIFEEQFDQRVASVDPAKRHAMGPRFFQLLVDKTLGSATATQFIGHIPESKAEPHRHLYEEALIILSGEGMLWTESRKARVHAGDIVFLPRKQIHSLQCTAPQGMEVVGVIHPGDNPGINY
jgi:mannose-6-phosphate isomerase-like protein (cupin superfamily)/CDGSH-type Zn-finger protein